MKWKDRNRISILLKDQRVTLLRLASIKLRHLAQPHFNFDSVVKHIAAYVSLEDCANSFKNKDDERFIQASGRKRDHYATRRMENEPF